MYKYSKETLQVRFKENTDMFVCVCLFIYQITPLCVCIIMSAL